MRPSRSVGSYLRFVIPSAIGIFFFLTPVSYQGKQTIVLGLMGDWIRARLLGILPAAVVAVTLISAISGLIYLVLKPAGWPKKHPALYAISHVSPIWAFLRVVGAICGVMFLFQLGPEAVWGEKTGKTVFVDIGTNMLVVFLEACFLMAFLTDYGLMEFVGGLLRRFFERFFRLPGRAAIDATASFVSAASVGLLITIGQYERGYYSARHAAVIATNFSVVSVPFALLIAEISGLGDIFFSWYATVILACLVCALITPRLPPLSRKSESYFEGSQPRTHERVESGETVLQWSLRQAVEKAEEGPGVRAFLQRSSRLALDVIFGVIPPTMGLALLSAIVIFHTDLFHVISFPVQFLLEMAHLPEAEKAAPGFLVGFLDQFMPAVIATGIEHPITRFVLAGLSVGQLIYLSEVGVLILRSSLPISLSDLAWIFALRTVLLLPIFLLLGSLLTSS